MLGCIQHIYGRDRATVHHNWLMTCVAVLLLVVCEGRTQSPSTCVISLHHQIIDLTSLAEGEGSPRFSLQHQGWNYAFSPCEPFNLPYNPLSGFGDLCHYVLMCRWREDSEEAGYYTLGIQQKATYLYTTLPPYVASQLHKDNIRHFNNPYIHDMDTEEEDSDESSSSSEEEEDYSDYGVDIGGDDDDAEEEDSSESEDDSDESDDDVTTTSSLTYSNNVTASPAAAVVDFINGTTAYRTNNLTNHNMEDNSESTDHLLGNITKQIDNQNDHSKKRDKRAVNSNSEANSDDKLKHDSVQADKHTTHTDTHTTRSAESSDPLSDSSSNSTRGEQLQVHRNKLHRLRHQVLMIQLTGIKNAQHIKTNVILVCDITRTTPESALLTTLTTMGDTMYFTLRYVCCCPDGCRSADASIEDIVYLDLINGTISNGTYISRADLPSSEKSYSKGAQHLWMVLLCNALVLGTAIFIGTVCCGKGRSGGPYNALPVHLQSSRVTMASVDSRMDTFKDQQLPDRLEYSTAVSRSAQLPKLRNCLIPAAKLELGQRLGGGLYGDTYLAMWRDHKVAAKRITVGTHGRKLPDHHVMWFKQVVSHLSNQRHKNLVTILGICIEFKQPYLINEFVPAESLKDKIAKEESLDLTTKAKICAQAADGIAYLHSARPPILHRDIRACNILVDSSLRVKVVDFGLITMVQNLRQQCPGGKGCFCDKERSAFPASIRWTAPEILRHPGADEEMGAFGTMCDVFSFGMLMWEVLIQLDPYDDIEDEIQVQEIVCSGGRPAIEQLDADWSYAAIVSYCNLMKACWLDDAAERPSFKQICVHLKSIQTMSNKKSRMKADSSTTSYLRSALSIT